MKKIFIELLEKVQVKSDDCLAHFVYHSDHSGKILINEREEFAFEGEEDLEEKLNQYLAK